MKYVCTGIYVKDIKASREFYENLFGLKVEFDFGGTICFEGAFSINENLTEFTGIPDEEIKYKSNNFELYFEEEDIDSFMLKLIEYKNITFVHNVKEYDWGQRFIRFYDLDNHIIQVAEGVDGLIKHLHKNGLPIEEIAKRSMKGIEYIRELLYK